MTATSLNLTCSGHGPYLYLVVKGGAAGGETQWSWQAFGNSDSFTALGSGKFDKDKTVDLCDLAAVANAQRLFIIPNPSDSSFTDSKSGVPDQGHYTLCRADKDGKPDPTKLLVAGQFGSNKPDGTNGPDQPDLLRRIPPASEGDLALTVTKWNDASRTGAGFSKIKHFFVLMMENRSFDHIFGFQGSALPGVDGTLNPGSNSPRSDCFSWLCGYDPNRNTVQQLVDPTNDNNKVRPFSAQDSLVVDPGHEFSNVFYGMFPWSSTEGANTKTPPDMHGFIAPYLNRLIPRTKDQGQWDGDALASHNFKSKVGEGVRAATYVAPYLWPASVLANLITSDEIKDALKGRDLITESKRVMEAFTAASGEVMNLSKAAQQYAVCDRWFASLPGPTWPNRLFVHCGGSGGLDDSPSAVSSAWKAKAGSYDLPNIYDTLANNGCEWMIYACGSNAQADTVQLKTKPLGAGAAQTRRVVTGDKNFAQFQADLNGTLYTTITKGSFTFLEPDYGDLGINGDLQNNLAAAFLHGNSQHPISGASSGDQLIGRVLQILQGKPDIWNQCALIVTHDEHGGFYDHVVPPAAIPPGGSTYHNARDGAGNLSAAFAFDRLGVRVPAVVISPLIPQGVVDHTVYDHTSIPATVRKAFGISSSLTPREAVANDFSHLFTLTTPRT